MKKLIAIVCFSVSLGLTVSAANAQTVTVKLPNNYTAKDLVRVEVQDNGNIFAYYQDAHGAVKRDLCGNTDNLSRPYKRGTPLEPVCRAAMKAYKDAK